MHSEQQSLLGEDDSPDLPAISGFLGWVTTFFVNEPVKMNPKIYVQELKERGKKARPTNEQIRLEASARQRSAELQAQPLKIAPYAPPPSVGIPGPALQPHKSTAPATIWCLSGLMFIVDSCRVPSFSGGSAHIATESQTQQSKEDIDLTRRFTSSSY